MKRFKPYLEVMPVVFIIIFVLIYGVFEALLQSLGYFPIIGLKEFTLRYYIEIISSKSFLDSLWYSLYISIVSSVIAVIIGVLVAKTLLVLMKQNNKGTDGVEWVYKLPIIIPHITVSLFAIIFLSDTGVFARILYGLGFTSGIKFFENILYSSNGVGIIIAYIWKESPYIMLTVLAVLKRIDEKYETTAINLGATPWYAFRKVTLPMLMPTILYTYIIIFAFSFGAYEIPFLLGSTVPKTLPIQAFIEYQNPMLNNRPYAMAINVIIIVISLLMVSLFSFIVNKLYDKE